jgi:hypothetical protein
MDYTHTRAQFQPTHKNLNEQYRPQILALVEVVKTH